MVARSYPTKNLALTSRMGAHLDGGQIFGAMAIFWSVVQISRPLPGETEAADSLAKILARSALVGPAQVESKHPLTYRSILLYVCWLLCLLAAVLASVEFCG